MAVVIVVVVAEVIVVAVVVMVVAAVVTVMAMAVVAVMVMEVMHRGRVTLTRPDRCGGGVGEVTCILIGCVGLSAQGARSCQHDSSLPVSKAKTLPGCAPACRAARQRLHFAWMWIYFRF
ncbi:unnamed protein product [Merluccius merluccius]